ncbi:hypothetical protein TeGR_g4022, partial [Tetraparma gracilis]
YPQSVLLNNLQPGVFPALLSPRFLLNTTEPATRISLATVLSELNLRREIRLQDEGRRTAELLNSTSFLPDLVRDFKASWGGKGSTDIFDLLLEAENAEGEQLNDFSRIIPDLLEELTKDAPGAGSRRTEMFFPKELVGTDSAPSEDEITQFVRQCLGKDSFAPSTKAERVSGGWIVRGSAAPGLSPSDVVAAVAARLASAPALAAKIEPHYIKDPEPLTDEEMELALMSDLGGDLSQSPVLYLTSPYASVYRRPNALLTSGLTLASLATCGAFSLGAAGMNSAVMARVQDAAAVGGDLSFLAPAVYPTLAALLATQAAHELGHLAAARAANFSVAAPTLLPSVFLGTLGAVTRIKSPPPTRAALFDFAAAGPLSGLLLSLALLLLGLSLTASSPPAAAAAFPQLPVALLRSSALAGGL